MKWREREQTVNRVEWNWVEYSWNSTTIWRIDEWDTPWSALFVTQYEDQLQCAAAEHSPLPEILLRIYWFFTRIMVINNPCMAWLLIHFEMIITACCCPCCWSHCWWRYCCYAAAFLLLCLECGTSVYYRNNDNKKHDITQCWMAVVTYFLHASSSANLTNAKTFTAIFYYPNLWRVSLWSNPNSLLFWLCLLLHRAHSQPAMQAQKSNALPKVFVTNWRARMVYAFVRLVQY